MYLLEIENFGTGSKAIIQASDEEDMHRILMKKNFDCLFKYTCYAGLDEEGNEISVTLANVPHVDHVKDLPTAEKV